MNNHYTDSTNDNIKEIIRAAHDIVNDENKCEQWGFEYTFAELLIRDVMFMVAQNTSWEVYSKIIDVVLNQYKTCKTDSMDMEQE